jgi:hypothetical protein
MHSLRLLATVLAFSLAFIMPSYAQAPSPAGELRLPQITHVPLTQDKVLRLLKSMPEIQAFGKQHQLNKLPKGALADPNAALMKYLEENNLLGKMQAILEKYGFKSVKEWSQIMQSMTIAYGFAKSGKSAAQMKNEMQTMISKVEADPNMTPEQKSSLLAMFRQQMAMALKMAPPAGNIEVVKQVLPQIEQAMMRK